MPAEDAIGMQGPEYEMDIERGRIRDFARAIECMPSFPKIEIPAGIRSESQVKDSPDEV